MPKPSKKKSVRSAPRRTPSRPAKNAVSAKRAEAQAPRSLAAVPLEALAAEIKRRQSDLPKLEARARELRAELASVEARIAALSGSPVAAPPAARARPAAKGAKRQKGAQRGPRRINGQPTLAERIVSHLGAQSAPQSPREIAAALGPALGREINQSFLVHISLTLRKLVNAGRVAQPARAQYALVAAKERAADAAS